MGTTYNVQQIDGKRLSQAKIEARLAQINAVFSTWDETSELSLLNKKPVNEWIDASNELLFVLTQSKKLRGQTHGYFDPGIGRLIDLWGFGSVETQQKPSRAQVGKALKNSSIAFLELRDGQVKKTKDIHLDLSAIAKGYAVDEIAKLLTSHDAKNFLVEIGGEVLVRGNNAGKDWTLGIEHPSGAEPIVIKPSNQAIATSGDYRNYFIWQGQKYQHILDAKTGLPAAVDLASVSVIHPQTMIADAYATAMMAMGSEQAINLANRLNLMVIMVLNKAHQYKVLKINL